MPAPPLNPFLEDAPDITCTTLEPFTPARIADMLHDESSAVGSVLLVEGIDVIRPPCKARTRNWRAVRMLLGDGELSIQALLATEMHRYLDSRDIVVGSYIKLEAARLQWSKSSAVGADDGMVFLIVHDLAMVGWDNRLLSLMVGSEVSHVIEETQELAEATGRQEVLDSAVAGGTKSPAPPRTKETSLHPLARPVGTRPGQQTTDSEAEDSGDGKFETMAVPETGPAKRRADSAAVTALSSSSVRNPAWSSTDPTKPLKLTPLRSIPNLPYKQNWSVNVLAIVSSLTELQPSTLPPFSQRQARLAHPSTPKLVHLTVFLDPAEFTPQIGSAVLLLGVKNHRFDGGSLKKYSSDRPRNGGQWWFEDPTQFSWCDVEGLTRWWDLRLR